MANSRISFFSIVSTLKTRLNIIRVFIFLCFAVNSYAQESSESKPLLQGPVLTPEKGVTLLVERLDELNNFELRQTDGSVLLLPYVNGFEVADFNFDGYDDLRAYRIEGRNASDELFVYMPAEKKYMPLAIPDEVRSLMLCDGFMNTKILDHGKALVISCHGERIQHISFDYLQFKPTGQLWLQQQYRYDPVDIPQELLAYTDLPWGMPYQLTIYTESQTPAQSLRTSQAFEPIVFKALTALALNSSPENAQSVILNLKQGQICNLISLQNQWLQLSCNDLKGNEQTGWLDWQSIVQHSSNHKPFILTEASSAKLY